MYFHPSQLLPAQQRCQIRPPQFKVLRSKIACQSQLQGWENRLGKTNGLALAAPPGVRFLLPFMRLFFRVQEVQQPPAWLAGFEGS